MQTGLGHREVLLVYMGWMGMTAAGAVLAAAWGTGTLIGAWVAALLGLVIVLRWVVRRERMLRMPATRAL